MILKQNGESFRGETTQLGVDILGETRRFLAIRVGMRIVKTTRGGQVARCTYTQHFYRASVLNFMHRSAWQVRLSYFPKPSGTLRYPTTYFEPKLKITM